MWTNNQENLLSGNPVKKSEASFSRGHQKSNSPNSVPPEKQGFSGVLSKAFQASINVAQLLKEPIGSSRSYQVSELTDEESARAVTGVVTLIRSSRGILVKGTLTAQVELICSRCLSPVDYLLNFDIDEEFFPTIDVLSGSPLSLPEGSESFAIDHNHILDLREVVRQYILLNIPMKPLCSSDCAGLCSSCGHNLNQGHCQCFSYAGDRRWSKLEELKSEKRS